MTKCYYAVVDCQLQFSACNFIKIHYPCVVRNAFLSNIYRDILKLWSSEITAFFSPSGSFEKKVNYMYSILQALYITLGKIITVIAFWDSIPKVNTWKFQIYHFLWYWILIAGFNAIAFACLPSSASPSIFQSPSLSPNCSRSLPDTVLPWYSHNLPVN